jgi:predicted RNase H-like nuclease (RuvC/YqgF family)
MSANFKTCMFGGFDREDVVSYIEKTAKETQEKLDALETENAKLKADNEQIEQALRTLHAQTKQMKQEEQDQESLQQRLDEAQARAAELAVRCEALEAENESLRASANECAHLKEHIADIEINAHRRTEEFRAEAIEKLRAIIAQQRTWCQKQRGEYAFMSETILQDIRRAEDVLENADYSGFDQMMEGLQQLEDTLQ